MRVLLLCEGDAETWDSWSGTSRSLVEAMRAHGHHVVPGDVDLYGMRRLAVALFSYAPARRRWWVRFHLGASAFRARSRQANRVVRAQAGAFDAVLQFGATFLADVPRDVPYFLYCDANIELSRMGARTGVTEAAQLTEGEIEAVRAREQRVYDRATRIFTMSECLRRTFLDAFDLAPGKVTTVHGGPNLSLEDRLPPAPDSAPGPPTVLFVGRAFERKGGPLLLDAFRRVRNSIPEARLRIIGPDRPSGVESPGVEWLGFLNKDHDDDREVLAEAYLSASVFCLPTRFEPFGVVFLEAMSHGLPCIGPRAWAVPEIVADGETGLLFEPDDVGSLAETLDRLLRDPALAREMGRAGHLRLHEHFTWGRVAERILDEMRPSAEGSAREDWTGDRA